MRVSATFFSQSARKRFCSAKLWNLRPLSALFCTYLTPASTLPLCRGMAGLVGMRSEEHTSELQSRGHLVSRLLIEKKKDQASARTMTSRTKLVISSIAEMIGLQY